MKFVYIESYGCSASQNNAEIMKGLMKQAGLDITNNPEIADVLIINSCIVKGPTENKIKERILKLQELKKPLIISGCMPDVRKDWLKKNRTYLLGINNVKKIVNLIRDIRDNKYSEDKYLGKERESKLLTNKIPNNKKIGITQISEGCLGDCSYCLTKLVKGALFSYDEGDIIENIKRDIEAGCKEIWLTSQDCAAYGLDKDKTNLLKLLREIIDLEGKFKIRIGMMNPNHLLSIIDELVEICKSEKIYKFFHIPVQSGSNRILKKMNRKYKEEGFLKIIKKIKENFPEAIIATDVIVGFPDETEEDFEQSLEIIRRARPDIMNTSRYWAMKGTRAAEMPQLDRKTIDKRAEKMQTLHLNISKENNEKFIGRKLKVLVSEYDSLTKQYRARDENYRLVLFRSEEKLLGKIVVVEIKRAFAHYLVGDVLTKT